MRKKKNNLHNFLFRFVDQLMFIFILTAYIFCLYFITRDFGWIWHIQALMCSHGHRLIATNKECNSKRI